MLAYLNRIICCKESVTLFTWKNESSHYWGGLFSRWAATSFTEWDNMKRLFGADGIRGVIDQYPFRKEDQRRLGQSLALACLQHAQKPVILLGTDTRESNQRIKEALVEGLTCAGVEVWDVGIIPTAAISYLVASHPELYGGVMVSASHNPILENGIKVFDGRGMKLSDQQEAELEEFFSQMRPKNSPATSATRTFAR